MATRSQRKEILPRRRTTARGLVTVEVQAYGRDVALIRSLAEKLRDAPEIAQRIRSALKRALMDREAKTAFDIFGSDLPDDAFAGVFDQPRYETLPEIDP